MISRSYIKLTDRRVRGGAQLVALASVAFAIVLLALESAAAHSAAAVLLGGVALAAFKIGLIALNRPHPLQLTGAVTALHAELADLRRHSEQQLAEVHSLAQAQVAEIDVLVQTLPPLADALEHQKGLSQRTEPMLAEFATLRYEVIYLRETVERLRSEMDV